MKLSPSRVGALVWLLIYGGLILCGLGVALSHGGIDYGWGVSLAGVAAAVAGVVLIYVRSRMADGPEA